MLSKTSFLRAGMVMTSTIVIGMTGVATTPAYASGGQYATPVYVSNYSGHTITRVDGPGDSTTFASGLNLPSGVAVDQAGNVFVADFYTPNVYKYTPDGARTIAATGVLPGHIAVDNDGDLYTVDFAASKIKEYAANGTQRELPFPDRWLSDVEVDRDDNIYGLDITTGNVLKIAQDGSFTTIPNSLPLIDPTTLALDSDGDIYVTEPNHGTLVRIGTDATSTRFSIPGVLQPAGVTFDDAGNMFVTDYASGNLVRRSPSGGVSVVASDLPGAFGVGIKRALPESFEIAPKISGNPTPAVVGRPYTFTFTSSGFPAPTFRITRGSLPSGLSLNAATGEISGTPTRTGTSAFTVSVTNGVGSPRTLQVSINVTRK